MKMQILYLCMQLCMTDYLHDLFWIVGTLDLQSFCHYLFPLRSYYQGLIYQSENRG